jgi:carbon-monoxide dehydrogenase small subunit
MERQITLLVNGQTHLVDVEPGELLIDVLREKLNLTGTKKGCGTGDCGACTIIMGGKAVTSCLILAAAAEGKEIITIEGLAENGKLHPIQQSFIDKDAIQCGYCTPGLILTAKTFLEENPDPSEAEIRAAIAGNLCRCTGYVKIVDAIQDAAETMRGGQ